jgi:hypothetical protein
MVVAFGAICGRIVAASEAQRLALGRAARVDDS